MKVLTAVILVFFMLSACGKSSGDMTEAMDLRHQLGSGDGCSFRTTITADYGDRVYSFTMDCKANTSGDVQFRLVEPETISGISGTVTQGGGKLEFDDQALLFEPLTQGQLTPVIGPWLMVKTINGGYIRAVKDDGDRKVFTIDDSFGAEKLLVLLTLQKDCIPVYCEIFWNNRRVLSLNISSFQDL